MKKFLLLVIAGLLLVTPACKRQPMSVRARRNTVLAGGAMTLGGPLVVTGGLSMTAASMCFTVPVVFGWLGPIMMGAGLYMFIKGIVSLGKAATAPREMPKAKNIFPQQVAASAATIELPEPHQGEPPCYRFSSTLIVD